MIKEVKQGDIVYWNEEFIENGINYGNKRIRGKVIYIVGINIFVQGNMNMTDCYLLDKIWGSLDNVPQIKLKVEDLI